MHFIFIKDWNQWKGFNCIWNREVFGKCEKIKYIEEQIKIALASDSCENRMKEYHFK